MSNETAGSLLEELKGAVTSTRQSIEEVQKLEDLKSIFEEIIHSNYDSQESSKQVSFLPPSEVNFTANGGVFNLVVLPKSVDGNLITSGYQK